MSHFIFEKFLCKFKHVTITVGKNKPIVKLQSNFYWHLERHIEQN